MTKRRDQISDPSVICLLAFPYSLSTPFLHFYIIFPHRSPKRGSGQERALNACFHKSFSVGSPSGRRPALPARLLRTRRCISGSLQYFILYSWRLQGFCGLQCRPTCGSQCIPAGSVLRLQKDLVVILKIPHHFWKEDIRNTGSY